VNRRASAKELETAIERRAVVRRVLFMAVEI